MNRRPPIEQIRARADLIGDVSHPAIHGRIRSLGSLDAFALSGEATALAHRASPAIVDLAGEISKRILDSGRPVLIPEITFDPSKIEAVRTMLVLLAACLGTPTSTDQVEGRVVWDVTPRARIAHDGKPTITERPGEAEPHTDSSYKAAPESLVMFFVLQAAADGGGKSILVDGMTLLQELTRSSSGRFAAEVLSTSRLPFRVPTSFTRTRKENEPEYVLATVLEANESIRYRGDRIDEGLDLLPEYGTPDVQAALAYFKSELRRGAFRPVRLSSGDLIVIDNRLWLHGRTTFRDPNRHLLRVRIENGNRI